MLRKSGKQISPYVHIIVAIAVAKMKIIKRIGMKERLREDEKEEEEVEEKIYEKKPLG
jgi:hypothetical protein